MTSLEVAFHDTVLSEIDQFIASHPPERGGALIGPVGQPVISAFIADPHAAVTGMTYTPSESLRELVKRTESADANLELKGIVHSHPSGLDRPSGGDHRAFEDSLRKAPWLGRFICPIVTAHVSGSSDEQHRIQLGGGTLSVFVAEARVGGRVQVEPARARVIPFGRDLAFLARRLGAKVASAGMHITVAGTLYSSASLSDEATDVTALFPLLYPTAPPVILLTRRTENGAGRGTLLARVAEQVAGEGQPGTVALPLRWSLNVDDRDRLADALDGVLVPAAVAADADVARDGIRARLDGAVAPSLQAAQVLIVGLGSGGSQTAEALTRASVERFVLIDPDQVGPENLSRSVYELADVGKDKAAALAGHLAAINPAVSVRTVTSSLDDIDDDDLTAMIKGSDLVIAATDDPKAQLKLNHKAWSLGVPAVFGGVYARGHAGEVVFTVPGVTKCYRCAAANRESHDRGGAGINYGTGQLIAEPALGTDISHIVTASVKIAIGLLELGDPGAQRHSAGGLVLTALANGYQFVIMSTVPEYEFFPKVFKDAAAQHGYQSVWMSVEGDPDCLTCGTDPGTLIDVTGVPDLTALRPLAE